MNDDRDLLPFEPPEYESGIICDVCGYDVNTEHHYCINGEIICEHCIDDYLDEFKVETVFHEI